MITFIKSYFVLVVAMSITPLRSFMGIFQHITFVHISSKIFYLPAKMRRLTMLSLAQFFLTGCTVRKYVISESTALQGGCLFNSEIVMDAGYTYSDLASGNLPRFHLGCFILWFTACGSSFHWSPTHRLQESQWL